MTYLEAAEHLRQKRQLHTDTTHREALQIAEQALLAQERQSQMLRNWQTWAQVGAK